MATPNTLPRVIVFAGPNGAGKSTHADAFLAELGITTFVNADFIARGLSGNHTEAVAFEAGRIMLRRLRQLADTGEEFAFESTLSSRTFAPFLADLKVRDYRVILYYFALSSATLAVRRVRARVTLGGHGVPDEVVRRRFSRSVNNFFNLYAPLADIWTVYDNSANVTAAPVAKFKDDAVSIKDPIAWLRLQKLATAP